MANGIYYVDECSGNNDDAKIAAAISAAHNNPNAPGGGGKVVLSNRTYTITQSIVLYSNIIFTGVGNSSYISCSTDVPIIRINRGNGDSSNIEIRDMALFYATMASSNSFHIEADRPIYLKIYNVAFYSSGRDCAGVLTWNADADRTTPISANSGYAAFMTHIENCLFNHGSIWLNDSDSRIINNYIWANETSNNNLDFAIRLSNGSVNISGNDIVAGNDAGIYLAETCAGIRIENNYFDGSWFDANAGISVNTGWGVYVDKARQVIILGNEFANIYLGGIYAYIAYQITILGNVFINMSRTTDMNCHYDIALKSDTTLSTGHIVAENQHIRSFQNGQNCAVFVDGNVQASVVNNSLLDWRQDGYDAYVKPPFYMWPNKYSIRRDNRVTNRATGTYPYQFDEGEVTVPHNNSTQTIPVSFAPDFSAQNIVPKVQDIHINFVAAASNSSVVYSIWGVSNSGFNISVRPVDSSSSSSGVFCWRVSLQ